MNRLESSLSWEASRSLRKATRQNYAWDRVPAARQRPMADGVNVITAVSGNNSGNERISCRTPANADMTDFIVEVPGNYVTATGQANIPIGYTITVQLEYPAATFTQFRFAGATSQAVTAGRTLRFTSDKLPIAIPRNTQFWIKQYRSWTGGSVDVPLASAAQAGISGEWLTYGTGLSDLTTNTTPQTPSLNNPPFLVGSGFGIAIYGRVSAPVPVLGIMGDSIYQGLGGGEIVDSVYGGAGFERGLRSVFPVINVARFGEQASHYTGLPDGRAAVLRDSITHLLIGYGRNDLDASVTAAAMVLRTRAIADPFLTRGVQVFAGTITPKTTSSDGFITAANQTIANSGFEAARVSYNALLRANYLSYGFTGVVDFARVVDPTDSGKWLFDGTTGKQAVGIATLSANSIASVARASYAAGTAYGGAAYPINQSALACVVYRYPDDPIRSGDAVVTCATDGSGVVSSFSVVSGGSYSIPPMICPTGIWTNDGTHLTNRAYSACIAGTGFGPGLFRV